MVTIQKGNTNYWLVTLIDKSSNMAVEADSGTAVAKLYDSNQNVLNSSLPLTFVSSGYYQVTVDTSSLDLGKYILEFSCKVNGVNKVKREWLTIVFV